MLPGEPGIHRGDLTIDDNDQLVTLGSLPKLEYVSGSVTFSSNNILSVLDGLIHLDSIGGSVIISENQNLVSLNGFAPNTYIPGQQEVY